MLLMISMKIKEMKKFCNLRLRNLGSTPDAVARRCVLGKDT